MKKIYPAGGWLAPGTPFTFERQDQGQDLVIPWQGILRAPGAGYVANIGHDRPFPNGFGPRYPIVHITTGRWANHYWYIGHCTSLVNLGEKFTFGHPIARADQGHDFEGTHGGWVELGQAPPGAFSSNHWYRPLFNPLVVNVPEVTYKLGDKGFNVLKFTNWLKTLKYLNRPWYHYNKDVEKAVIGFQKHHKMLVDGRVGPHTWLAIEHSAKQIRGKK